MMQLDDLTNDAQYLLLNMYREYLDRHNGGTSKFQARKFESENEICTNIMPQWPIEDVHDTIAELNINGFVQAIPGNNIFVSVDLTTSSIAVMEQRFANNVDKILERLSKIKSLIPFI
ncbi:hypothetical protein [Pediococcus pentosaceus]|uniref:Uncharacterized protein n=2 Tax=Pediococcus TaxID=1253 RepID=A0AB73HG82_PEDPE|nr:hypothetical protein [Pediococcus pentosaceus]MBF7115211.1 hypothetical protein [Pediococcus pentosaceus]MCM6817952.1 hypothetical protein [Pediococcus pentosaceus]MDN3207302.1 hypothetical protein [Pediococcus pentosaceus]